MRALLACLLVILPLSVAPAATRPTPFGLCEQAAARAEAARGLPGGLLPALARVESGRPDAAGVVRPWPWTIDVDGQGRFFASKAEAVEAVRALQADGTHSIDVGCLQVNLLHHPAAFPTLEAAFDPAANALYAARFLAALHARDNDWAHAIAAYHSETQRLGSAYRERVLAIWHPDEAPVLADPRRAAYADFLPRSARYAAFAGCKCVSAPGQRPACRCD
ncbi:MAG TPA: transglycosylase SLT domain-containing protein [Acetobacteraceae bacterium]|nr:transglycosylase SLT domain-containing protein [Acetobacteraceae bacterium]